MSAQPDENTLLDVRQVTPNTIPSIASQTSHTEEYLMREYQKAVSLGTTCWVLMSNPMYTNARQLEAAAAYAMGKCYYELINDDTMGWTWTCVVHGRPSRHHHAKDHTQANLSGSRASCLRMDPYP